MEAERDLTACRQRRSSLQQRTNVPRMLTPLKCRMQNIGQCIIISRKIYQEGKAATISTIYKMSLVLSITGLVLAQSPVEPIEVHIFLE